MRYVYLGSPVFSAVLLEHLCRAQRPPLWVVTQRAKVAGRHREMLSTPVGKMARKYELELIETENVNEASLVQRVCEAEVDYALVVAFGQIFKKDLLGAPREACLNIHASLLPRYRGAAPIARALWAGEKATGVCLQRMVSALDAGDVLDTEVVDIAPSDTTDSLTLRLAQASGVLMDRAWESLETKSYVCTRQREEEASYAPKLTKKEARLSWSKPAHVLEAQVRALYPWPIAYTHLDNKMLKVYGASLAPSLGLEPGQIQTDYKTFFKVQCAFGGLALEEVQLENKKRMPIPSFLAGYRGEFKIHV